MEKLRASEIFRDSGFSLIAVDSVEFRFNKANTLFYLSGNIEPIALIVCTPGETYALDMEAKPIAFDQLRQNIPELDGMIKGYS